MVPGQKHADKTINKAEDSSRVRRMIACYKTVQRAADDDDKQDRTEIKLEDDWVVGRRIMVKKKKQRKAARPTSTFNTYNIDNNNTGIIMLHNYAA